MLILVLFAFMAGVVTVLSPCILPLLPIILSSTADTTGKRRPIGIVVGFIASFTFFTLFLSSIVNATGISPDALRSISIVLLILFGLSLVIPQIQLFVEQAFSRLANINTNSQNRHGFSGGVVVGFSLGLLWTPCVGPILASVISLAISGTVTAQAAIITFAFALGTGLPMLAIMLAGSTALKRVPWLVRNTARIQKTFGIIMIITAVGLWFNVDRRFQTAILTAFPQYGQGLTAFEENNLVKDQLKQLNPTKSSLASTTQTLAPEIIPGGVWINTPPLTLASQKGKVVLIDFWTYTCINCQRTLPYLRDWWTKYKDQGLVIIGVHAPEFAFEKSEKNVRMAARDFNLQYPIVQDNNFATWRAYNNRYWPAKYLIDATGNIRYTHFGEGKYDETENQIQALLKEAGSSDLPQVNNPTYQTSAQTPETYLGFARIANVSSPEKIAPNTQAKYSFPAVMPENTMSFSGDWTVMSEYATPTSGSRLKFSFSAQEVFLVMRPSQPGVSARVKVTLDGQSQTGGADVNDGFVTVDTDRLYKIIRVPTPGRHILELEFVGPTPPQLFAFTFG